MIYFCKAGERMKPQLLDTIDKIFGTRHKKADPKAERKKQMRKKKIDSRFVVLFFGVVLVLLVAVSVVTVISERDDSPVPETSVEAEASAEGALETSSEGEISEEQLPLQANILLAFTEDGNSGLELLSVMNVDSETETVKISYIPVSTVQQVKNFSGTMKEHIENGGIGELLLAVGKYAGISMDRYICLDEADFVDVMKEVGEFEVNIEEDINHEYNGINFIIDKGIHSFAPDAMLRYIVYLCQTLSSDTKPLTDIIIRIAERLIADENGNKTTSESYEEVINYVDTDISAIDIVNYSQAISELFDSGVLRGIEIEPDIGNLVTE